MDKTRTVEALAEKAGDLAYNNERTYGGCAQSTVAAVKDTLGKIGEDVYLAATALAGGGGRTGHACGAFTGGLMALSCFWGRPYDDFADSAQKRPLCFKMAQKLERKFQEEYGTVDCHGIHEKLMGRAFDLRDPNEFEEYIKAGGHDDKCPSVCRNAARWVVEILADEGLAG